MRSSILIVLIASQLLPFRASPAKASFSYGDFVDADGLTLHGSAHPESGRLRLTPAISDQLGVAWRTDKQMVAAGFETTIHFQILDPGNGGADEISLLIQNTGPDFAGPNMEVIPRVSVELDTWDNSGSGLADPNDNHVAIDYTVANGQREVTVGTSTAIPQLDDGAIHVLRVRYVTETVTVFFDDSISPALSVQLNIADTLTLADGSAWIGVYAATGSAFESHDILAWSFTSGAAQTPTRTPTTPPSVTAPPTPSDTPVRTDSPTTTPTPTVTVNPTFAACTGNCDADPIVGINELVQGVNIANGILPIAACTAFDTNSDGSVAVNELVAAVNNALYGCGVQPPTHPPTVTATPLPTSTATPSPSATLTLTITPTRSVTGTPTRTNTPPTSCESDFDDEDALCGYLGKVSSSNCGKILCPFSCRDLANTTLAAAWGVFDGEIIAIVEFSPDFQIALYAVRTGPKSAEIYGSSDIDGGNFNTFAEGTITLNSAKQVTIRVTGALFVCTPFTFNGTFDA